MAGSPPSADWTTLKPDESSMRQDWSYAPGFIDMHSHSDVTLLDDPGGESKVFQGVTTEVTGNCGFSPFPIGPSGPEGAGDPDMASIYPWNWKDLDGWADALESSGISINVAPQVGHSSIRSAVGLRDNRRPTADELEAMRRLVAESIEQGAFSFSTGLTVAPSMYGDTEEVVALAEAMSPFEGAFYVTHARLWAGNHVKAVEEAVEIGRRAGVPVQYSHMAIIDSRYFGTGDEMVQGDWSRRTTRASTRRTTCTRTRRPGRTSRRWCPCGCRKGARARWCGDSATRRPGGGRSTTCGRASSAGCRGSSTPS